MSRQVGDERARYPRKSHRERLDEILSWGAAHPVTALAIVAFVVVGTLVLGSGLLAVRPDSLAVGDCLFVRTASAQEETRPIGAERVVSDVLLAGGAERTACGASHGHEVAAIVVPPPAPTLAPGEMPALLDATTMRAMTAPLCEAAFAGYVGRPLSGSRYVTFPAVPDAEGAPAWLGAGRRTVCLVARADGAWMDHPARGSGE